MSSSQSPRTSRSTIDVVKDGTKQLLRGLNIGITSYTNFERLNNCQKAVADLRFLLKVPDACVAPLLKVLTQSRSQLRQDLFALSQLNLKREGFFVEFGATDGVSLSNTYLLEKVFGWTGILAEPARCWQGLLQANRRCSIDDRCVWTDSTSSLMFTEADAAEFSTVTQYSAHDSYGEVRRSGQKYRVQSVSLVDLLDQHRAPREIDYLSIDTEGSEYEILSRFDFDKYCFNVITCEHNYTPNREKIHDLLASKGYERVFADVSLFDDWFVRKGIMPAVSPPTLPAGPRIEERYGIKPE